VSLGELAEAAGVSRQYLDQVARGDCASTEALRREIDAAIHLRGIEPRWPLWEALPEAAYRRLTAARPRREKTRDGGEFANFSLENWDFWNQRRSRKMLPEEALRHFGLRADPFEEPTNPEDFWKHPQLESLRAIVRSAIHRGGFLLVQGPSGSGKTIAVRYAVGQLAGDPRLDVPRNQSYQIARLLTLRRRQTTGCSLPRALLRDFSPGTRPRANAEDLIAQVAGIIAQKYQQEKPQTCALVIEEAHELAADLWIDLKKLREICADAGGSLAVICVGQTEAWPNLADTLAQPELASVRRRLYQFSLKALSAAQAKAYTSFRLARAGATSQVIYAEALDLLISQFSRGGRGDSVARLYPASLDTWLSTALIEAWDKGVKCVTKSLMSHVLATGGGDEQSEECRVQSAE
jgi:type II secretory pathway predicted ATPase ExeA